MRVAVVVVLAAIAKLLFGWFQDRPDFVFWLGVALVAYCLRHRWRYGYWPMDKPTVLRS